MTIKEVEEQTGLARSNVRFYEKEKLIEPLRKESNGYRDYSEADVENIKKIAYLRTLKKRCCGTYWNIKAIRLPRSLLI